MAQRGVSLNAGDGSSKRLTPWLQIQFLSPRAATLAVQMPVAVGDGVDALSRASGQDHRECFAREAPGQRSTVSGTRANTGDPR